MIVVVRIKAKKKTDWMLFPYLTRIVTFMRIHKNGGQFKIKKIT